MEQTVPLYEDRVLTALGMTICSIRMEKHMTQEELSGLAEIARTHLAAIESGRKKPRLDTLWNIAYALRVPLSDIVLEAEGTLNPHNREVG